MNVSLVDIPQTLKKWGSRMLEIVKENEEKGEMEREAFFLVKLLSVLYSGEGIKEDLGKYRKELGEQVAKNNAVPILLRYMNLLTEKGTKYPQPQKTEGEYFQAIRSIFWNFSDRSLEFCQACEKSGLFEFLANDAEKLKSSFKQNSAHGKLIYEAFSIFHNCAKAGIERSDFLKIDGLSDLAEYYWRNTTDYKLDNDDGPSIICTFFYGAIADEHKIKGFVLEGGKIIDKCIDVIEKAMDRPERSHDGYSIGEMVYGLTMIARNIENRKIIAKNERILGLLQSLTENEKDCDAAVQAISILMDLPEEDFVEAERKIEEQGKENGGKISALESSLIQAMNEITLEQTQGQSTSHVTGESELFEEDLD